MSMTKTGRRLMVLVAAMAALMMVMAGPASAAPGVAVVQGNATLNGGVGTCNTGTFSGSVLAGAHLTVPPSAGVLGTANANFNYCDPLIVTGDAQGTLTVSAAGFPTHSCGFTWLRVGLTAVVTFSGGASACTLGSAAVAAFAPTSVPGSVPSTAAVAGVGLFVH